MVDETGEPDWGLLPHHPDRFFGLEGGHDRLDLKRAYNRLLKRFKPERYPEEFQRIRAAFEQLDRHLQYAAEYSEYSEYEDREDGLAGFQSEHRSPGEQAAEIEAPVESFETAVRLADEPLEEIAAELRRLDPKPPENWCHLALFEDELRPQDPLILYEVLMAGARATGGAPAVLGLLSAACQEPLPTEIATALVRRLLGLAVAEEGGPVFDANHYWLFTEPLWLGLPGHLPFDELAELLEHSRNALGEEGFEGYLGLLIKLIPRVSYQADERWLEDAMELIEESYHQLSPWVQAEVVAFDWLNRYSSVREPFLTGDPARARLDEVLVLIAANEQDEALRAFRSMLSWMREQPEDLLTAFPPHDKESYEYILEPLWWYAEENAERLGGMREHAPAGVTARRVKTFVVDLEKKTDRSLLSLLWLVSNLAMMLVVLATVSIMGIAVLIMPGVVSSQVLEDPPDANVLVGIGWAMFLAICWKMATPIKGLAKIPFVWLAGHFSRWIYVRRWRRKVVEFLRKYRLNVGVLTSSLTMLDGEGVTHHNQLAEFVGRDTAVALYSLALQFDEPG